MPMRCRKWGSRLRPFLRYRRMKASWPRRSAMARAGLAGPVSSPAIRCNGKMIGFAKWQNRQTASSPKRIEHWFHVTDDQFTCSIYSMKTWTPCRPLLFAARRNAAVVDRRICLHRSGQFIKSCPLHYPSDSLIEVMSQFCFRLNLCENTHIVEPLLRSLLLPELSRLRYW